VSDRHRAETDHDAGLPSSPEQDNAERAEKLGNRQNAASLPAKTRRLPLGAERPKLDEWHARGW
jgi:hypothetical protein